MANRSKGSGSSKRSGARSPGRPKTSREGRAKKTTGRGGGMRTVPVRKKLRRAK